MINKTIQNFSVCLHIFIHAFVHTVYVLILVYCIIIGASQVALVVKNLPANARDADLILGSGRSLRRGNGNPLQYSWLGNPIDRAAWCATVWKGCKELDMTEQQSTCPCTHKHKQYTHYLSLNFEIFKHYYAYSYESVHT